MDKWEELKKWIEKYLADHTQTNNYYNTQSRYCVAISCDDLLEKMYKLEEKS